MRAQTVSIVVLVVCMAGQGLAVWTPFNWIWSSGVPDDDCLKDNFGKLYASGGLDKAEYLGEQIRDSRPSVAARGPASLIRSKLQITLNGGEFNDIKMEFLMDECKELMKKLGDQYEDKLGGCEEHRKRLSSLKNDRDRRTDYILATFDKYFLDLSRVMQDRMRACYIFGTMRNHNVRGWTNKWF